MNYPREWRTSFGGPHDHEEHCVKRVKFERVNKADIDKHYMQIYRTQPEPTEPEKQDDHPDSPPEAGGDS